MYLYKTIQLDNDLEISKAWYQFGGGELKANKDGLTMEQIQDADKIEVWATSFNDEGPDYCEFRLMKKDQVISSKRVDGY